MKREGEGGWVGGWVVCYLLAGVGAVHVVGEEREDVGVLVQGLHSSDLRPQHLEDATRGGLRRWVDGVGSRRKRRFE